MSAVSASWSIGLVIGPAVGGYTSRPAEQYHGSFLGNVALFQSFPYLLPNVITAILSLASMCMIFLFLPETLNKTHNDESSYEMVKVLGDDADEESDLLEEGEGEGEGRAVLSASLPRGVEEDSFVMSFVHLLQIESVRTSVFAYTIISFTSIVYDELLPLWALSEQQKGG
jgi:MFS family permease